MDPSYCWRAIAYVERNPIRAGMVDTAEHYRWSSASARMGLIPPPAWLHLSNWREQWTPATWTKLLGDQETQAHTGVELREATLSGFPLGSNLVDRPERDVGHRLRQGKSGLFIENGGR